MSTGEYIFLFGVTMLAFTVKAITGFGNTIIINSLFSQVLPNIIITPIDLTFNFPANVWIVWRERKDMSFKAAGALAVLVVVGIIPGTFLLTTGEDWMLRALLGFVIIALAVEMYFRTSRQSSHNQKKPNRWLLIFVGIVSGVLIGLFGIGALLVAYISRVADNRSNLRGSICFVFLIENVFRIVIYTLAGIINIQSLTYTLWLAPAVVLGLGIGTKLDKHMDEKTVVKMVIILLLVSGATLVVRNIFLR